MMRAAGFKDEKTFFKAVEAGKIMAKDVLPKFAEELSKMAKANGALDKVTHKTRAEMNRFFNQLALFQNQIFGSGYGEGLAYMFGSLSDMLKEMQPWATGLGRALGGALTGISAGLKLVLVPFQMVGQLFSGLEDSLNSLGLNDKAQGMLWQLVGGGGVLALLAYKLHGVAKAIGIVNVGFMALTARLAPILAVMAFVEDLYMWQTNPNADTLMGRIFGQPTQSRNAITLSSGIAGTGTGLGTQLANTVIEILFNDNEASKIIKAEVTRQTTSGRSVTLVETTQ